jgi:multiple sugar transport system permease protein
MIKTRMKDRTLALVMLIPSFAIVALLIIYPLFRLLWYSAIEISTFSIGERGGSFVFLSNYITVLRNKDFIFSIGRGLLWTLGVNAIQLVFGVIISLLLYEEFPGRNFLRGLFLFPYLIPTVVAVLAFRYMFSDHYGIMGYILPFIQGLGLGNKKYALLIVIFVGAWRLFPFTVILVLARLQTISPELYEAARIDGAGKIREIFHITLPLIKPVLIIDLLLRTIFTFNIFDLIWLMTKGGPVTATETPPILLYKEAFFRYNLGTASAMGVFLAIILFLFSIGYLRWYETTTKKI